MTTSRHDIPGPRHGGDIAFAAARYGIPAGDWLDLSTGINPEPWPLPPIRPADWSHLPGRDALADLLTSACSAYEMPPAVPLLATPGTEIAIRLLPHATPPGAVAILGPTYGSHADAWRTAGRVAIEIGALDKLPDEATILVLANPNNPDGRIIAAETLAALAGRLHAKGGLLIVDEAFADAAPGISLAPRLDRAPALVLRSFGKFYGLAGIRLGFAAGPAEIIDRLAALLGDWAVSGPALTIGRAALADRKWQAATRLALADRAKTLRALFGKHGLAVIGGTDLFILIGNPDAGAIHRRLAERGIWTRIFDFNPGWLRLGVPASSRDLARLDAALSEAVRRPPTTE